MPDRDILYPTPEARIFAGKTALTAEDAKELLDWEPLDENSESRNFHLVDRNGDRIFLGNNGLQRPYYPKVSTNLMFEILSGNWEFNFETVIVGESGYVIDGKHRLSALIFAVQEWENNPDKYPIWDTEPVIDIVIGFGAKETKRVVNTIGTGKSRSLADSLYASGIFGDMNLGPKQVKNLTKFMEFAVRMLWHRTGAKANAYSPTLTHQDALDFIERHPTLLTSVRTVFEENNGRERRLFNFLPGGACAALLYLMSVSASDPELYHKQDYPTEDSLSFANQELAERFWLDLAKGGEDTKYLRVRLANLAKLGNVNKAERLTLFIKAWNLYKSKKKLTLPKLKVNIKTDKHGNRVVAEDPHIDGIDLGRNPS